MARQYSKRLVSRKRTRPSKRKYGLSYRVAKRTMRSRIKRRTIPRTIEPFPQTKLVRHRYVENATLPVGSVAGAMTSFLYSANDMYDPNVSGTGHQPMYRDEMAARYRYYTVLQSYIRITFEQSTTVQANYGILLSSDSTPGTTTTNFIEQHGYRNLWHSSVRPTNPSQRNTPLTLWNSYNAKRWYKTDFKGLMADDQKKTPSATTPSEILYYYVYGQPFISTDTVPSQRMQVEITYIVVWRDPQDAVPS